ncbi:IS1 family transposase [Enterobacter sp. CC120223-11]|uniref:IS1 family transposase n=1 Tax=Enterobacter sp. CC120223-11 TaxID=1378073 RepID=UPI001142EA89|nr:IS1 family transposase [Enterobacter sp. CC120223-11]
MTKSSFSGSYNYHRFLPPELHRDADALIDWLAIIPYLKPEHCPHCESPVFHTNGRSPKDQIINYRCSRCKKGFSPLTGTLLARSRHIPLWPVYAAARLSGLSTAELVAALKISEPTCLHKDRVIASVMRTYWPALCAWWEPHYERRDPDFTPEVTVEAERLKNWYRTLKTLETATCPLCGGTQTVRTKERPSFRCRPCDRNFSLLSRLPVSGLRFFESWGEGINALVAGDSVTDIKRCMKMSLSAAILWEKRMMLMLEIMELHALKAWILWQRNRDRHRRAMLVHHHGVRFPQAGLVRSQRKKT